MNEARFEASQQIREFLAGTAGVAGNDGTVYMSADRKNAIYRFKPQP